MKRKKISVKKKVVKKEVDVVESIPITPDPAEKQPFNIFEFLGLKKAM